MCRTSHSWSPSNDWSIPQLLSFGYVWFYFSKLFIILEPRRATISKVFGVPTAVFKCHNLRDGLPYSLIRVDTPIRNIEFAQEISELWKQIQHSGIVTLREVFRSSCMFLSIRNKEVLKVIFKKPLVLLRSSKKVSSPQDHCSYYFELSLRFLFDSSFTYSFFIASYFFAFDYHPGAETLESKYIQSASTGYIQEDVLWAIIVQLVSVIQCVHERRQACRGILSPSKILVTSRNKYVLFFCVCLFVLSFLKVFIHFSRIRLNCVAIEDVLDPDTQHTVAQSQYFDLLYLGRLIVNLACKSNEDNFARVNQTLSNPTHLS